MADNPYTLIFGQEPNQIIARTEEFAKVTNDFSGVCSDGTVNYKEMIYGE